MDKKDLERRLEAAEKQNLGLLDEIKNLKAQLANVQDEPEIPDKPDFETDEKFYYLDSLTNDVEDSSVDDDNDAIDFNMFHTEEYAREFRRKCLLIAMMLHCKFYLCPDYVPDWRDASDMKWTVIKATEEGKFDTASCIYEVSAVHFDTAKNAQKCAEWLNKHWRDYDD